MTEQLQQHSSRQLLEQIEALLESEDIGRLKELLGEQGIEVLPDDQEHKLLERAEELLKTEDATELKRLLSEARTSDVAEVVEVVDEVERQILFDLLDPRDAGEVLEKIDDATRAELVEDMTAEELTHIVATLPPDEAADVVDDLPPELLQSLLSQIPAQDATQIRKLLRYEEDTAGGIMNSELVKVTSDATIGDALEAVRRADANEDFFHVFVVDKQGRYQGEVDLRRLLHTQPNVPVLEVMTHESDPIHVGSDQEEIATTFRKNDLFVMPVVDSQGVLLGRITVDDVLDVMEEEAEEDALMMAGTHPDELLHTRHPAKVAMVRLPWLIVCMCGAMISAGILYSSFETAFSKTAWFAIVMFAPAIAAMGGNSGLQTSTIVCRGLATGDLAAQELLQIFLREYRVTLIVAVCCAILAGGVSAMVLGVRSDLQELNTLSMGFAVGISMFAAISLSTTMGLFLPFLFRKLGIDPALSSGPLVTTLNDALGILTYFALALLLVG